MSLTRWAVPAGVVAAVVGVSLLAPVVAAAEPDLPDRTAAELLADLRSEPVEGFSGTVVYRADLGLSALPLLTGGGPSADGPGPTGGSTDLTALLDGEHTLRVWAAAPDLGRVSLHGEMGELTVVSDGADLWTWSSDEAAVTRFLLPEHDAGTPAADKAFGDRLAAAIPPMTPEEVADLVLGLLDRSTAVSVGDPVTVAGRPAYQLVLEPRADGTLVESVRIAVDAADRVPTQVQVFGVGHDRPALEVGFTRLSLVPPGHDVFAFAPPPGATVEVVDLAAIGADRLARGRAPGDEPVPDAVPDAGQRGPGEHGPVAVVGEGWASVLVAALPAGVAAEAGASLEALPRVSGAWGSGRLVTSRLFSALLTDDGRVLVGPVDAETLQRAAAEPAAAAEPGG